MQAGAHAHAIAYKRVVLTANLAPRRKVTTAICCLQEFSSFTLCQLLTSLCLLLVAEVDTLLAVLACCDQLHHACRQDVVHH